MVCSFFFLYVGQFRHYDSPHFQDGAIDSNPGVCGLVGTQSKDLRDGDTDKMN